MKTTVMFVFCFLSFFSSKAQVIDLTGTWTMFEMTYLTGEGEQKMTEEQMIENSSVSDYFFMEEGKFKLTSNMTGSGVLETYEGKWTLAGDKLTLSLQIGENMMDVVWDFQMNDDVMNLSRTNPDGTFTIINTFRRK